MKRALILAALLIGCAGVRDAHELTMQGYRLVDAASGQHHQLWVKETGDGGRKVQVCIVPMIATQEYYWSVRVLLDDKEAWTDNSVVRTLRPDRRVNCVTSRPLAEGRLLYWASFQYKDQQISSPVAPVLSGGSEARIAPSPQSSRGGLSSVEVPIWNLGDEWRIHWSSPRGSGTFVWSVVREEMLSGVPHYVVKVGTREIYYTKDERAWVMDRVEGLIETRASPNDGRFTWPLTEGKEWEVKYHWENPNQRMTEDRRRLYRVEATESITVPAGTFQTFHVTMKDPTGKLVIEYWYSPDVKWIIKDRTYFSYGVQERELLEYKIR